MVVARQPSEPDALARLRADETVLERELDAARAAAASRLATAREEAARLRAEAFRELDGLLEEVRRLAREDVERELQGLAREAARRQRDLEAAARHNRPTARALLLDAIGGEGAP